MKKAFLLLLAAMAIPTSASAEGFMTDPDEHKIPAAQQAAGESTPDLFPETSRAMHRFNMRIMHAVRPEIDRYRDEHSPTIHGAVRNLILNLKEPITFANAVLQLDFEAASRSIFRFTINSTFGIAGIIDVAGRMNVKRDKRDFGQTLAAWGAPMGGFFVLPIYAQTNTRDFIGGLVDGVLDPMYLITGAPLGLVFDTSDAFISVYEGYDFVISTDEAAVDSYSTFKTIYLQNRAESAKPIELPSFGPESEKTEEQKTSSYDFDME
jgi:phospholipid-binding lipoprotein MlaA